MQVRVLPGALELTIEYFCDILITDSLCFSGGDTAHGAVELAGIET